MEKSNDVKCWERTNVTNLLRNGQSGTYYARVKVSGKDKWRTLDTKVFSVAKLKLPDVEKAMRAAGVDTSAAGSATVSRFIAQHRKNVKEAPKLAASTKARKLNAIKAIEKTWPGLGASDARRLSPADCKQWAGYALQTGTGFVAPNAKTKRRGMSSGAFNKCVEELTAIFTLAQAAGVCYANPAKEIEKAPVKRKHLELPSVDQFRAIVQEMRAAKSRDSGNCADMVQFLAFSGARLAEAVGSATQKQEERVEPIKWKQVDFEKGTALLAGTKSTTSHRIIPLFPPLRAFLEALSAQRGEEGAGAPILRIRECKGALARACAKVGVKRMTHHDLRHLFATRCIENGVDIPTVSRWLGHADGGALAMRTYGHLRQEHSQAQAAKVSF